MQQQIVQEPTVDYFQSVAPSLEGLGEFFVNTSPIVQAARRLKNSTMQVNGVGAAEDVRIVGTGGVVVAVAVLALAGALSYQAGKAMAPSKKQETAWGWIGVPAGLFFPFIGLGVMGAISNSHSQKR